MLMRLFFTFFKIGLFSFGGGYAMLPLIKQEVVDINRWMSNESFTNIIGISQVTPGPLAINTATYVGYKTSGIIGSVYATLGGKVNRKEIKDFNFDLTASILMTPKVYTDIFKDLGKNYEDYFEMIRLEPIYNVFYADNTQYSFYRDLKKTNDVLESIESGLSQEYEEFFYKTMKKYQLI